MYSTLASLRLRPIQSDPALCFLYVICAGNDGDTADSGRTWADLALSWVAGVLKNACHSSVLRPLRTIESLPNGLTMYDERVVGNTIDARKHHGC